MISIRKSGNTYQYCFEAGKVNGKRKQITKCGYKTKNEAYTAGQKAYDEFINGVTSIECNMLYGDYLDFMLKHNGGEGDIGATWLVLYKFDELEKFNGEIKIEEFLPDSIIIGSNGAGELYGVDSSGEYFNVPEIIEKEYVTKLGKDFNKPPSRINGIWRL